METTYQCRILKKQEIAPGIFDVTVECGELARKAQPGQFLHIKCGDEIAMPLRRPISICDVEGDTVRFLFQVKGKGTSSLSTLSGELDVLGPLGNPFTVDNIAFRAPAVIGGGIGTFPLLLLSRKLERPRVYLGFRCASLVTLEDEFRALDPSLCVCTDDGSYGTAGFAADVLERDLAAGAIDIVYGCGPTPMLRRVKELTERYGVRCQLSMEQRMGCGIGACLTCSCETTAPGTWKYKRVCKNGPVFWADELVL